MIIRVICGQKKTAIEEILTLVIKEVHQRPRMFNVQVSGLHLKSIRATLNYIKYNR